MDIENKKLNGVRKWQESGPTISKLKSVSWFVRQYSSPSGEKKCFNSVTKKKRNVLIVFKQMHMGKHIISVCMHV